MSGGGPAKAGVGTPVVLQGTLVVFIHSTFTAKILQIATFEGQLGFNFLSFPFAESKTHEN